MGLDLQNDYDKAKSKISAYKTTVETKKTKVLEKKENATTSLDKKKSDVIKQISEIENKSKEFVNKQKNDRLCSNCTFGIIASNSRFHRLHPIFWESHDQCAFGLRIDHTSGSIHHASTQLL